jgi:hypothetical protein
MQGCQLQPGSLTLGIYTILLEDKTGIGFWFSVAHGVDVGLLWPDSQVSALAYSRKTSPPSILNANAPYSFRWKYHEIGQY